MAWLPCDRGTLTYYCVRVKYLLECTPAQQTRHTVLGCG